MLLNLSKFRGEVPRIEPQALASNMATECKNAVLTSGSLVAAKGDTPHTGHKDGVKTITPVGDGRFLQHEGFVSVLKSSIALDARERVYIFGKNQKGTYEQDGKIYTLGVPYPTGKIVARLEDDAEIINTDNLLQLEEELEELRSKRKHKIDNFPEDREHSDPSALWREVNSDIHHERFDPALGVIVADGGWKEGGVNVEDAGSVLSGPFSRPGIALLYFYTRFPEEKTDQDIYEIEHRILLFNLETGELYRRADASVPEGMIALSGYYVKQDRKLKTEAVLVREEIEALDEQISVLSDKVKLIKAYANGDVYITSSLSSNPITHAFVYTVEAKDGSESAPSDPVIVIYEEHTSVMLEGFSTPWLDTPDIDLDGAKVNIYRSTMGGAYRSVASIDYGANAAIIAADTPGEFQLETLESDVPPEGLFGVIAIANGSFCGISGREICFSEPYKPQSWPVNARYPVHDTPIALGAIGNTVIVLTDNMPYRIVANQPDMANVSKIEQYAPCISPFVADTGTGIAFVSWDGLYMISAGGAQNLTSGLYTEREWEKLHPSSISVAYGDGHLYCATSKGLMALNLAELDSVIFYPRLYRYISYNPYDGFLYGAYDGAIRKVFSGDPLEAYWKSKLIELPYPINFSACEVVCEGDTTIELLSDGKVVFSKTVSSRKQFSLPLGFKQESLQVAIRTKGKVHSVSIATSQEELKRA